MVRLPALASAICLSAGCAFAASATGSSTVHSYQGAVPVLCYHGIHENTSPSIDPYSIDKAEFTRQIAMLSSEGFHAISIAQYARFAAGDFHALPDRPILITFDDGRLDSYQGADQVLARYGMRATMFVIAAKAGTPDARYLSWAKLAAMSATGRWDLQEHANRGHVLIPTGPGRQTGPYYANLLYRDGVREKFTAFKRRVSEDILAGRRLMASHIPGFKPLAFAPPYDSYGQVRTNYRPIPGWESAWLERTFKVLFVQDHRVYNLPGKPIGQRYGVRASTTAEAIRQWLAQALPRSAWTIRKPPTAIPPPAQVPTPKTRPGRPTIRRLHRGRHTIVIVLRRAGRAALRVTRRRAGRRRSVRVNVRAGGRVRDRRLRPGTTYVYRVVAIDRGRHSRALEVRVRTRRR
jgi:peptidoglycan/xylan/chitin deacetylase (PgdA/CDA1 family)